MTNENKNLIYIPKDGNYIEILGHKIDGFNSFEAFCEHLNKYVELEEMVQQLQSENKSLKNAYKQCAWERDVFYDNAVRLDIEREESQYTATVGMISDMELAIEKAKIEAYKECAEWLKEEIRDSLFAYEAEQHCERIDNILREKIGE